MPSRAESWSLVSPRPDDVLDGEVVAVEGLLARVGVDHADERRDVQPEVVEERRVLAEVVGVVGIVVRGEPVSGEQDDALPDLRAQLAAARGIGFCREHNVAVFHKNREKSRIPYPRRVIFRRPEPGHAAAGSLPGALSGGCRSLDALPPRLRRTYRKSSEAPCVPTLTVTSRPR